MKLFFNFLKGYLPLLILCVVQPVVGQQEAQYTQYMYNTLTINPAYTGSTGGVDALLLHRSQWIGIDGAPRTQAFTIHAPMWNEKVGLGLSAVNERIGPTDEFHIDGNFSYTLYLGQQGRLAFGLKAGARSMSIDWSRGRYYQEGDPLLNRNINNNIAAMIGSGVYYYTDKWYAGVSVPNFIRNDFYDDVQESVVSDRLHYYIIGGYVFDLSESLKFKPAFLGKLVTGAPVTVDASANFMFQEKFVLGASYRWDDSVSALAGFQINDKIFVGYSYDYSTTDLNKYNDGSHEFVLRFQLKPKTARIKSPRFF
ncbi:MAG: hypothetical protein BM557_04450 [Flavobacterium sp. MedPE-SWcel]|uniref:PorP/SprF family type IX secretion system membrane protein n=1 Tax=uncultured Flavobacterium sp. TaxID=165435 RepID=UPI000916E6EE|nr:type IX secretion system membrane protein PorP/SprF [uncultured Flavobacterium sp.]OIQ21017.1 MAG: hypothetical protein BM557_04450 [Flavobacterium sp. MedPE-SWcel]